MRLSAKARAAAVSWHFSSSRPLLSSQRSFSSRQHHPLALLLPFPLLAVFSLLSSSSDCDSEDELKASMSAPSWVQGSQTAHAECWIHQPRPSTVPETGCDGKSCEPARAAFIEVQLQPAEAASAMPKQPTPLLHNTLIVLPDLLVEEECELIALDTERILRENAARGGVKTEKWATFSSFTPECQKIMDKLLRQHLLEFIESRLPDVAVRLFHRNTKTPIPAGMPMSFYWDEPVVIKYVAGNRLAPHEDMRELTIVVPLNPTKRFPLVGGGTRFWLEGECADSKHGVLLKPPPGSGIIFNGDITHSGNSVFEGTRFLLMTSINLDVDAE